MVGGDADLAARLETLDEHLEIVALQQPSLVVPFLRPGVGEVDVKAVHRLLGHEVLEKRRGVGTQHPDVRQAPASDPVHA